ncbi:MAG: GNAT family N-acetyltransferase [Fimbriimonadaceae bacterium]|nr:GNAT family N-acetyltransferase [Chthonomonadaceae bacterium]MCO5298059.1 GNAT family N-acetyltransferase [Fimbriimonadaceae bacterium]
MELSEPVLLDKSHDISGFDCGKEPLNVFLKNYALANQQGGLARTYVVVSGGKVVGYYSLAPAGVEPVDAPERVRKGQPSHPVPCILLARLAVDKGAQGTGLGKFLFRDAMLRALRAHEQIGGRAFLVHAMDDEAKAFYSKYGMLPSPTHPMHLFLLFKDIRAMLGT